MEKSLRKRGKTNLKRRKNPNRNRDLDLPPDLYQNPRIEKRAKVGIIALRTETEVGVASEMGRVTDRKTDGAITREKADTVKGREAGATIGREAARIIIVATTDTKIGTATSVTEDETRMTIPPHLTPPLLAAGMIIIGNIIIIIINTTIGIVFLRRRLRLLGLIERRDKKTTLD